MNRSLYEKPSSAKLPSRSRSARLSLVPPYPDRSETTRSGTPWATEADQHAGANRISRRIRAWEPTFRRLSDGWRRVAREKSETLQPCSIPPVGQERGENRRPRRQSGELSRNVIYALWENSFPDAKKPQIYSRWSIVWFRFKRIGRCRIQNRSTGSELQLLRSGSH